MNYLRVVDSDCTRFQQEDDVLYARMAELQAIDAKDRDTDWFDRRREFHAGRHSDMSRRRQYKEKRDLDFAKTIREICKKWWSDEAAEALELSEFTHAALDRLRAKEEEEKEGDGLPAASSQGGKPHARKLLMNFFLHGSGRTSKDGLFGAGQRDPVVTDEQEGWQDEQWAEFFLALAGFEASPKGAAAECIDGWLALHHAIDSTVFWSQGIKVVRGLIEMMPVERLRAKTLGGHARGYTAMHLAASGSDKNRQRWEIVELLLQKRVEANAKTPTGNTPLLLAAGTGVIDVMKVLVSGRADLNAVDNEGKSALDKALRSSGKGAGCPHSLYFPQASVTLQYVRTLDI